MKGAKKAAAGPIACWFFWPLFCVKPLQVTLPFGIISTQLKEGLPCLLTQLTQLKEDEQPVKYLIVQFKVG